MEEVYNQLVSFIENKYKHILGIFASSNVGGTGLYCNVKCKKCNFDFALDMVETIIYPDWNLYNIKYSYSFHIHNFYYDKNVTLYCNELVIKSIIE